MRSWCQGIAAALAVALLTAACDTGAGTVQDAAPRYQAVSDAYMQAITAAALTIQTTHPAAATITSAMSRMEQATHTYLGGLRQIQFPDSMQAHVKTMDADAQTLANADLLLVNEAQNLNRADVSKWNQLDSQWRADDKQLRQDLGLTVPDFDNH
ncbi:MAG TPA: hypothetical protein VET65_00045 [Candidatus Limnocylindrales bacterium]|nr:hypothetical protein [Candidatus Limnocylindrales bacterium]